MSVPREPERLDVREVASSGEVLRKLPNQLLAELLRLQFGGTSEELPLIERLHALPVADVDAVTELGQLDEPRVEGRVLVEEVELLEDRDDPPKAKVLLGSSFEGGRLSTPSLVCWRILSARSTSTASTTQAIWKTMGLVRKARLCGVMLSYAS